MHRLTNSINEIKEKFGGIVIDPSSQQTPTISTNHHIKRSTSAMIIDTSSSSRGGTEVPSYAEGQLDIHERVSQL